MSDDSDDDARLVARCLEAKEAFEQIYRRHAPAVFGFLKGLHRGDEHAAADTLQETFFRAFRALPRFDRARPLRPWLLAIASNAGRDAIERRHGQPVADLPGLVVDPAPSPAEQAATGDACRRVLELAARRIPARALAAFLLARTQGLSLAEVAEMHDCSLATVKRDLADALAALAGAATELGLA